MLYEENNVRKMQEFVPCHQTENAVAEKFEFWLIIVTLSSERI
jgi:hypothetical protein